MRIWLLPNVKRIYGKMIKLVPEMPPVTLGVILMKINKVIIVINLKKVIQNFMLMLWKKTNATNKSLRK